MKKILSIVFLILMVIFISGCTKEKTSGSPKTKKIINTITALEAWEKVKPKADEWSNSYKIASISDISTANYQRIDGQAIGWQFYLEECQKYYTGSMSQTCKKGKTRTFYYHTEEFVGEKKGITADNESSMTSGRGTFDPEKFKINSDKAQELARQAINRERNNNEEFVMKAYYKGGIAYWEVRRQCWVKGDRDNCDSDNGYIVFVNIENGETYEKEPKSSD